MRRMRIPNLVLAATLALLLPLEQAHCAWMGLQKHAAPVSATSTTGHACCGSATACVPLHHSQPKHIPQACRCAQIPLAKLPTAFVYGGEAPSVSSLVVLTAPSVIAPVSFVTEIVPALDVGNSLLPDDPDAHGLRAPPASA